MIVLDGVTVITEDDTTLLGDVTTTIPDGRTAVIGANGSGKPALARRLNGLVRPTRGRGTVDGRAVAGEGQAGRAPQPRAGAGDENDTVCEQIGTRQVIFHSESSRARPDCTPLEAALSSVAG